MVQILSRGAPRPPKKSALNKRRLVNPVDQARHRLIAIIIVGVLLVIGTYFFYASPALSNKSAQQSLLAQSQSNLKQAIVSLENLKNGTSNPCNTYRQAELLDAMFPVTEPTVSLADISNLVTSAGMKITTISPPSSAPVTRPSGVSYVAISIAASGTYSQIQHFVNSLSSHQPLLTLAQATLTSSTTTGGVFDATLVLNVWWYPSSSPLPVLSLTHSSSCAGSSSSQTTTSPGSPTPAGQAGTGRSTSTPTSLPTHPGSSSTTSSLPKGTGSTPASSTSLPTTGSATKPKG